MKRNLIFPTLLLMAAALSAQAQEAYRGWNWYESWNSSFNTDGSVNKLDSTAGYDFNKHVGVTLGLPFYFVHASNTTTTSTTRGAGVGDMHLSLLLRAGEKLDYVSEITGTAPTGSRSNGLTSGRATVDWNNHFDATLRRILPFADLGVANTVPDSFLYLRPYTSLGVVGHFDGGAVVKVVPKVGWGLSGYAIEPVGTQKVFSRLVKHDATGSASSSHGRVFQDQGVAVGDDLTHDHGFNTWLELDPSR